MINMADKSELNTAISNIKQTANNGNVRIDNIDTKPTGIKLGYISDLDIESFVFGSFYADIANKYLNER